MRKLIIRLVTRDAPAAFDEHLTASAFESGAHTYSARTYEARTYEARTYEARTYEG
jgi:hypothetical protein